MKQIVLTFDDAVKSHLANVAPLLREFGFGATFFVCRFAEEWRARNGAHLLSAAEVKQLADLGFEIGNHTVNHPDLRQCSPERCAQELAGLNDFLAGAGVPRPVSFAYPGGPFADNAVPALANAGLRLARTTEQRAWHPAVDSRYRIPSVPLQKDDEAAFLQALSLCEEKSAVVLVFHGVPDPAHEFVSTSLPFFRKCLEHLAGNGYRADSLGGYAARAGLLA